jgi:hypothetical protein
LQEATPAPIEYGLKRSSERLAELAEDHAVLAAVSVQERDVNELVRQ